MKGDKKVIEYLNKGLRSELTAINQYWLHYRILDNWGLKEMAKTWKKESIEEMVHADRFVDRILFLEGFPNMQTLDALRIGETVPEVIECDLKAEIEARVAQIRQVNQGGQWIEAPVAAATVQKLEDIILTRARDLRRTAIAQD